MFKVGDRVRFVTTEPEYEAVYYDGELEVISVYDDGDVEVLYPSGFDGSYSTLTQSVSVNDIELVS